MFTFKRSKKLVRESGQALLSQSGQALLSSEMQKGQALLIVVLVMAVALVVVLSVSTRTGSEVSETTYSESALRAFSAAEAGVEEALLTNSGTGASDVVIDSSANVRYSTTLTTPSSTDIFNHPEPVLSGQSRTFWFVSHDSSGALSCSGGSCTQASEAEFCWGVPSTAPDSATTPAIEVSLYYDTSRGSVASPNDYQALKIYRITADTSSSRRNSNNFGVGTTSCSFGNYSFSTGAISLTSAVSSSCATGNPLGCLVMAKARLLYNTSVPHPVGIRVSGGNQILPAQGIRVDSTGVAGESTRKVSVFRSFSEPQSVFDAGVFSYNDLSK